MLKYILLCAEMTIFKLYDDILKSAKTVFVTDGSIMAELSSAGQRLKDS